MPSQDTPSTRWPRETHHHLSRKLPRPIHAGPASLTFGQPALGAVAALLTVDQARTLARDGFVVLTYSARGFGRTSGQIALNSPDYEVTDAGLSLG